MKTVSFTEFRRHASGLFSEVQDGATLLVLRHGRPIAEIGPVPRDETKLPSWKRPGMRLVAKGVRLSAAMLEARKSESIF